MNNRKWDNKLEIEDCCDSWADIEFETDTMNLFTGEIDKKTKAKVMRDMSILKIPKPDREGPIFIRCSLKYSNKWKDAIVFVEINEPLLRVLKRPTDFEAIQVSYQHADSTHGTCKVSQQFYVNFFSALPPARLEFAYAPVKFVALIGQTPKIKEIAIAVAKLGGKKYPVGAGSLYKRTVKQAYDDGYECMKLIKPSNPKKVDPLGSIGEREDQMPAPIVPEWIKLVSTDNILMENPEKPWSVLAIAPNGSLGLLDLSGISGWGAVKKTPFWIEVLKNWTAEPSGKIPRYIGNRGVKLVLRFTSENITYAEFTKLYEKIASMSVVNDMTKAMFELDLDDMKGYNLVDKNEDLSSEYVLLGKSPFHDYETWIEKKEMANYLRNRSEGPKVRNIPAMTGDFVKSLVQNTLLKKKGSPDAMITLLNYQAKKPSFTTQQVKLTIQKLTDVKSSPRTQFDDQKTIMYKTSATDVAQAFSWTDASQRIKRVDEWAMQKSWAKASFYPAEWLHKIAFSYGGVTNSITGNAGSSQQKENLIFGTSEANSVMTRYETSFKLLTLLSKTNNGLVLRTRINNQSADPPEYYEVDNSGNLKRHIWFIDKIELGKCPIPFVAYNMSYALNVQVGGIVKQTKYLHTIQPFQRRFYTYFECMFDTAILYYRFYKLDNGNLSSSDEFDINAMNHTQAAVQKNNLEFCGKEDYDLDYT